MTSPQDPAFESWLERQLRHSASRMLSAVSPVSIVKHRPGFGQTVHPIPGAIVASPVPGNWDPDPDYFFHWFRDSAVVMDALRLLYLDRRIGDEALRHVRDFARFSLALHRLDGRAAAAVPDRRARVAPGFQQYLRDDGDLARASGDAVAADTRVNADGTLDISRWARPQHDGPPLRALAMLRWAASGCLDASASASAEASRLVSELILFDLDFTLRHWREPSYDIWEEESGHHYYTLRVAAAALAEGAAWLQRRGEAAHALRCREESHAVLRRLDEFWVADPQTGRDTTGGYYRSRGLAADQPGPKALDIAVILSAIHCFETNAAPGARSTAAHGVTDPRMQATLARLDTLFAAAYPINHSTIDRAIDHAVDRRSDARHGTAMGRYAGDVYFSGGAYYFSTLGAAEFCFRAASATAGGDATRWFQRGDAYLATVRRYTPDSGDLSEQFDQRNGAQTSAKHLAWSYAAFISCVSARRSATAAPRDR